MDSKAKLSRDLNKNSGIAGFNIALFIPEIPQCDSGVNFKLPFWANSTN